MDRVLTDDEQWASLLTGKSDAEKYKKYLCILKQIQASWKEDAQVSQETKNKLRGSINNFQGVVNKLRQRVV